MVKKIIMMVAILLIVSCKKEMAIHSQPSVLDKGNVFDLAEIDFKEDVPKLFSKHIVNENGAAYDKERDGAMSDSLLLYKVGNAMTESLGFKIPAKDFGYVYKTPEIDSIATHDSIYFNTVSVLTNMERKPVAFYAEGTVKKYKTVKAYIDEISKRLGAPTHAFYLASEFDQCSYEWDLGDRTMQIETSSGFGMTVSSDGTSESGKYYRIDMLILDNKQKANLLAAHQYTFPERVMVKGKYYTREDLNVQKDMTIKDNFLLNSWIKEYVDEEDNIYSIRRAEDIKDE